LLAFFGDVDGGADLPRPAQPRQFNRRLSCLPRNRRGLVDGHVGDRDLGAGTGRFSLAAARRFGQVTAVDISPAMLQLLRERAAAAGVANLRYVQAGFLSYQHAGPPANAVYSRNALHQLPDFWKAVALDRIAGMLRPGGVLRLRDLIYDFQPSEADAVFERWLDGAADDPARGYTAADLAEHIRSEHSTFGGCWSRCWPPPASKSSPRTLRGRCMAPTPAAGAEPADDLPAGWGLEVAPADQAVGQPEEAWWMSARCSHRIRSRLN
jgi:SAM-dependent methyltransferase